MRFCPNCGSAITSGYTTCLNCGKLLPGERMPEVGVNQYTETTQKALPADHVQKQNEYYRQIPPPPPPVIGIAGPPPSWSTAAGKKKKAGKGSYIVLALISLLSMGSGFWLIYYTTVSHPATLYAQATATIQARSTGDAQVEGTVQAQSTGTAIAQAKASATVQAQGTAQTQATTTALQAIYTKATSGTPDLNSALSSQDSANWDLYDAVGGGGCAFTDGALHTSVMQKNYYVPCFALNSNYSNFAMQAQMTIVKGDEGGLIFRGNQSASQFYLFRISQDSSYGFYISKDDKTSATLIDDTSIAIKKGRGQTNLLTIIAKGSNISLYINKQYVGSVSDTSYTGGKIGIFSSNSGNPTDVAFTNVQVWPL